MEAMVGGLASGKTIRTALDGPTEAPEELGRLIAEKMLDMGGKDLIAETEAPESW